MHKEKSKIIVHAKNNNVMGQLICTYIFSGITGIVGSIVVCWSLTNQYEEFNLLFVPLSITSGGMAGFVIGLFLCNMWNEKK
jgi:hypothetical protein